MSGHRAAADLYKAPCEAQDPGNGAAIVCDRSPMVVPIVTAGAETRTLPNPTAAGWLLSLAMKTDGGDCVITAASDIDQSGNDVITLNDVGDFVMLQSAHNGTSYVWRLIVNVGAALS